MLKSPLVQLFVFFLLALIPFQGFSYKLDSKAKQKFAVEAVLQELETHYGMIKYKEKVFGVSYDSLRKKYNALIDRATTIEESHGLVKKQKREILSVEDSEQMLIALVNEFNDGHLNLYRPQRNTATLGIKTAYTDNKLLVTGFSKDFYNSDNVTEKVNIGDEVISVNDESVHTVAAKLIPFAFSGNFRMELNVAYNGVLNRSNRIFRKVKEGDKVVVKFKRKNQEKLITGYYAWIYSNTIDDDKFLYPDKFKPSKVASEDDGSYTYGTYSTVRSFFRVGLDKFVDADLVTDIGALINFAEDKKEEDDKTKLKSVKRLQAYTVEHKGKMFGVLRIPNYSPGSFEAVIDELKWFAKALKKFEKTTDGLIIDQLTNGGGYVYYTTHFIKFFASEGSLDGMTIDMKLTETLVREQEEWAKEGNPENEGKPNFGQFRLSKLLVEDLKKRLANGDEWSGPMPIMGDDMAYVGEGLSVNLGSRGVVYTKPIMILNDGRSASGGDFFPSIMQKNKRAIVFGETSTGLGGPVYRSQDCMPGSEMPMRSTFGYCEFADGSPLENIGAIPDVVRVVVQGDLLDDFSAYTKQALDTFAKYVDDPKVATKTLQDDVNKAHPMNPLNGADLKEFIKLLEPVAKDDLILSTLYDVPSILERLKQLKMINKFANQAKQLDDMIVYAKTVRTVEQELADKKKKEEAKAKAEAEKKKAASK